MRKLFSTCLLVQEGSGAPELEITDVVLHPGQGTGSPEKTGKRILIAGGFSATTPESEWPVSATLQLNYDLATFNLGELAVIAQAELYRKNKVNFKSYTQEIDNRVCVIGDSAGQLEKFLDTYDGVLDIEPLLVNSYHPDIPTATELIVDNHGQKCRLQFLLRSPINLELCTYCGACGPACPEQCISENLFVNYDLCTFCRECEKICQANAIDIHSVFKKAIEVPRIIILGKPAIELPAGFANVFYERNLPDYFATLCSCQIDEVITCNNALCQFSGNRGKGCDLCLSSCPHRAILQNAKGVTVDSFKCEECGSCVAACPTGALTNERFNDSSFVDYFHDVAIPRDGTVVIGDEKKLHALWWRQQGRRREKAFFLQYDKVQCLSLFHFMFLFSRGARRILVLDNEDRRNGTAAYDQQIRLANELLSKLFDREDAVVNVDLHDFNSVMDASPAGSFGGVRQHEDFINRRHSLAKALSVLVKNSGRQVTMQPEGFMPFATVTCDTERCTQCLACLNDCRIEAMRVDQQLLALNHLGVMCVGCGLCVRICPEKALAISPEFTLSSGFFTPRELAKAEPMACKKCGKVFGTKKSFDRVMTILSEREAVDTSHFEYCDACRIVKLFE